MLQNALWVSCPQGSCRFPSLSSLTSPGHPARPVLPQPVLHSLSHAGDRGQGSVPVGPGGSLAFGQAGGIGNISRQLLCFGNARKPRVCPVPPRPLGAMPPPAWCGWGWQCQHRLSPEQHRGCDEHNLPDQPLQLQLHQRDLRGHADQGEEGKEGWQRSSTVLGSAFSAGHTQAHVLDCHR